MKRCPTCDKTFDDSMRFCQTDGTPLAEDAPPVDPYKTMVARPEDIAGMIPPAKDEGDVLQLPKEEDPLKTMYASEDEIRQAMASHDSPMIDIPPIEDTPVPEPPKFHEPSPTPPPAFAGTPPSPFSTPEPPADNQTPDGDTAPSFGSGQPIPSPFAESMIGFDPLKAPSSFDESGSPASSPYAPPADSPFTPPNPFQTPNSPVNQAVAQTEWTPPPAPDASWQNQQIGQNTPFQPPPAGTGKNQTLAIISLVTGILSLFCCGWFVPGIAAIAMGFIAKGKADSNPNEYAGRGLALGGIITGVISIVLGIIVVALYLFTGALSGLANF
ncbi:MAG: DUF4190 domain-containing protein [Acidobacteriota bacterium]